MPPDAFSISTTMSKIADGSRQQQASNDGNQDIAGEVQSAMQFIHIQVLAGEALLIGVTVGQIGGSVLNTVLLL